MSPALKLPSWFKQEIPDAVSLDRMHLLSEAKVNTVCQKAHCPNLSRCFKNRELTFMILGDTCTRNCRFCAVSKSEGRALLTLDIDETNRIAQTIKELRLNYVVITSVARDDLPDGGASHFAQAIKLIHESGQDIGVEVLIPDFLGDFSSIEVIVNARPIVVAHNLETVRRLSPELRPQADYQRSLNILRIIKEIDSAMITKSSLMLGLGENEEEIVATMEDLRSVNCDTLTLGQYLIPSSRHYPVKEFISVGQFIRYRDIAIELGFKAVLSGPLVRSSYQAKELYEEVKNVKEAQ